MGTVDLSAAAAELVRNRAEAVARSDPAQVAHEEQVEAAVARHLADLWGVDLFDPVQARAVIAAYDAASHLYLAAGAAGWFAAGVSMAAVLAARRHAPAEATS